MNTKPRFLFPGLGRALAAQRLLFFLWLANLVCAAALTYPLRAAFADAAGTSLAGRTLGEGFNFALMSDFIEHRGAALDAAFGLLGPALLFFLFLYTFFDGGIIAQFNNDQNRPLLSSFLANCGKYWGRLLRLFLWFLPAVIVFYIITKIMSKIAGLVSANRGNEHLTIWAYGVAWVLSFGVWCFFSMIFDYAKIGLVVEDSRKTFAALRRSFRFVFRNFGRTVRLYFSLVAIGLVFFLIYFLIEINAPTEKWGIFWLVLILQQLCLLSRIWLRLGFYSCQTALYLRYADRPTSERLPAPAISREIAPPFPSAGERPELAA